MLADYKKNIVCRIVDLCARKKLRPVPCSVLNSVITVSWAESSWSRASCVSLLSMFPKICVCWYASQGVHASMRKCYSMHTHIPNSMGNPLNQPCIVQYGKCIKPGVYIAQTYFWCPGACGLVNKAFLHWLSMSNAVASSTWTRSGLPQGGAW